MPGKRFDTLAAFVRARLSPEGHLGLHLTLGVLFFMALVWSFGDLAEDVMEADAIVTLDTWLAQWFHHHATSPVTEIMLAITHAHGPPGILLLSVPLAGFLIARRKFYWLVTLMLTVPGALALNILLKHTFARARPSFDEPLLTLSTYSFPSGHTVGATAFYGFLAAYLLCHTVSWPRRTAIMLVSAFMVALVGLTRLYLGAHYLSDVLAGVLEGLAWLCLCVTSVSTWRRRREAMRPPGRPHQTFPLPRKDRP